MTAMIQKNVLFACGCRTNLVCPADGEFRECLEHGALDLEYFALLEKENESLREEICKLNLVYALTSSDIKTRLIAEQIAKSQT